MSDIVKEQAPKFWAFLDKYGIAPVISLLIVVGPMALAYLDKIPTADALPYSLGAFVVVGAYKAYMAWLGKKYPTGESK